MLDISKNCRCMIMFKPKHGPDGRSVDDYLLKQGESYCVVEITAESNDYVVRNGAGLLVCVAKSDAVEVYNA